MISNYEKKQWKKKVFRVLVFRPFHIPIKLWLFVLYLILRDLSFPVWHFQGKVTAIAGRKQILAGNVIVVSHFVVGFGKRPTTLPTSCRLVIVRLLCCRQRRHVPVVSEYTRYHLTFSHDMFIKFIHHPRSTIHEGVGVIFRIQANSGTRKQYTVLVN